MIGTVHSVPRLMPGQGFILGVGTIGYPAEYEGADPQTVARLAREQGVHAHEHLRPPHHRGRRERRVPPVRCTSCCSARDDFYDEIFQSFGVPYEPARWSTDVSPLDDEPTPRTRRSCNVHQLINMYRVRGHLIANLDPLGRRAPAHPPRARRQPLRPEIWDLDREFPVGSLGSGTLGRKTMPLRDILGILRDAYSRTIGVEYMHIQEPEQKEWIQARVETPPVPLDAASSSAASSIGSTRPRPSRGSSTRSTSGQKRFSLEGAECLIPMLDALLIGRGRRRAWPRSCSAPRTAAGSTSSSTRSARATARSSASSRARSTRRRSRARAT